MSIEADMGWDVAKAARDEAYVRRGFWTKVRRFAASLPFIEEWHFLEGGTQFALRCRMIRAELLLGLAPLPQLSGLSQMVSGFAVRMETAITELGERAALAAELASSLERRGIDLS